MAYKAIYTMEEHLRSNQNNRDIITLELRAEFNFSKDIENPYSYMFRSMAPHAKEITERIEGDFLHEYILNREGFQNMIPCTGSDQYTNKEENQYLSIDNQTRKGFRLITHKDGITPANFKLDLIDLDALNEAIITGKL